MLRPSTFASPAPVTPLRWTPCPRHSDVSAKTSTSRRPQVDLSNSHGKVLAVWSVGPGPVGSGQSQLEVGLCTPWRKECRKAPLRAGRKATLVIYKNMLLKNLLNIALKCQIVLSVKSNLEEYTHIRCKTVPTHNMTPSCNTLERLRMVPLELEWAKSANLDKNIYLNLSNMTWHPESV